MDVVTCKYKTMSTAAIFLSPSLPRARQPYKDLSCRNKERLGILLCVINLKKCYIIIALYLDSLPEALLGGGESSLIREEYLDRISIVEYITRMSSNNRDFPDFYMHV